MCKNLVKKWCGGSGRTVFQDLPRINLAIEDRSFFKNEAYLEVMEDCRERGTSLHLMGLLSDGGVHSHTNHLYALLEMAKEQGLTSVYVHAFLDGRDVAPTSGRDFVAQLVETCTTLGVGKVATVMGRFYAMDRDKRWERVQKAYLTMTQGKAPLQIDPVAAVAASYEAGITDEFMEPVVCNQQGLIDEGDGIIFFNYRPDRAREITRCFVDEDMMEFNRPNGCFPVTFVCTTQYDASMPGVSVAFPPKNLTNTFGEYISQLGLTQLRIAETEKYAHVTFFFNGGVEKEFDGEDRVLIPSPQVKTYDEKPEMSAQEIATEAVARIESGAYDVIILNFANCDMVGHTGNFEAACKAVETVDQCTKLVVEATSAMGGVSLITADHGNAEQMTEPDGSPFTAHTLSPVPFYLVGAGGTLRNGTLADIAPTMLDLMGLAKPPEMDGETLICK